MTRAVAFVAAVQTAVLLWSGRSPKILKAGIHAVVLASRCPEELVPAPMAEGALSLVRWLDMPTSYPPPEWVEAILPPGLTFAEFVELL